jgi:hypothetical protein
MRELLTSIDHEGQFKHRLPARDVKISQGSFESLSDFPFIHTPKHLFEYLSCVNTEDAMRILSQTEMSFLYDMSYSYIQDSREISQAAIIALGDENVHDISVYLMEPPQRGMSQAVFIQRLMSGLRLAAALPTDRLASVFTHYSNVARLKGDYGKWISENLLKLLQEASYIFSQKLYEEIHTQDLDVDLMHDVITKDFSDFVEPIIHRYTFTSGDSHELKRLAGNFTTLRNELVKKKDKRKKLAKPLDGLLEKFGYKWIVEGKHLSSYVLVNESLVLEHFNKVFGSRE